MVDEKATFGMYDFVCDFIDVEILSDVLTGAGQDTISVQRRTDPANNISALYAINCAREHDEDDCDEYISIPHTSV